MEKQTSSHSNPRLNDASPTLEGHWLTVARALWLLITTVGIVMFAVGVPLRFQQLSTTCTGSDCVRQQLAPEALPAMAEIGLTLAEYAVLQLMPTAIFAVVCVAIGALIFWKRSHELMAFSSSLWLVTFGLTLLEEEVRATGAAYPWVQPAALMLTWLGGVILLPLFFFIFPNGRFVPRWTKWAWLIISVIFVSTGTVGELFPDLNAILLGFVGYLWFTMVLVCIAVQFYRFRYRSTANERQQTKWVVFAFAMIIGVNVTFFLTNPNFLDFSVQQTENAVRNLLGNAVSSFAFLMIPLGIGISILRHRLYDIDIIVRRTLQYGLLTGLLALIYFDGVITLQAGFRALTGQINSPIVTVLSTLTIAALFNPLRRRVQDFIDRRFYRKKYNAEQALARFAEVARDEVDMDKFTAALIGVVEETVQPERVSVWLISDRLTGKPVNQSTDPLINRSPITDH